MKDIYLVRRGVGREILSIRMTTLDRIEALEYASTEAIKNPGFTYTVYHDGDEGVIAKFYVKEEG